MTEINFQGWRGNGAAGKSRSLTPNRTLDRSCRRDLFPWIKCGRAKFPFAWVTTIDRTRKTAGLSHEATTQPPSIVQTATSSKRLCAIQDFTVEIHTYVESFSEEGSASADTQETLLNISPPPNQIALSDMCKVMQTAKQLEEHEKARIKMKNEKEAVRLRVSNTPKMLLEIEDDEETSLHHFRVGARTCAVLATQPGDTHRFRKMHKRVVVKLYKGKGNTVGSMEYQNFHERDFHKIPSLFTNNQIQQSISGGVLNGVGPYAVVQYIDGEELRPRLSREDLTRQQATEIVRDILDRIWIPLWNSGLRFKDCHPGNLVLTPDMKTVLIDTEMMRKDVKELLISPDIWTQRDRHERAGLSRLAGLVKEVVKAANPNLTSASIERQVKASLNTAKLPDKLALLGRSRESGEPAKLASKRFIQDLITKGLLE